MGYIIGFGMVQVGSLTLFAEIVGKKAIDLDCLHFGFAIEKKKKRNNRSYNFMFVRTKEDAKTKRKEIRANGRCSCFVKLKSGEGYYISDCAYNVCKKANNIGELSK